MADFCLVQAQLSWNVEQLREPGRKLQQKQSMLEGIIVKMGDCQQVKCKTPNVYTMHEAVKFEKESLFCSNYQIIFT